jgi:hypothetical protein
MVISIASAIFTLMAQSAAPVAAKPASVDPLEKIVCKRTLETGSLVKGKKVCLSKRQWNRVAEDGRAIGQEMQDSNSRIVGRE